MGRPRPDQPATGLHNCGPALGRVCCDGGCGAKPRVPYRTVAVRCFSRWSLPAFATVARMIMVTTPGSVHRTCVPPLGTPIELMIGSLEAAEPKLPSGATWAPTTPSGPPRLTGAGYEILPDRSRAPGKASG